MNRTDAESIISRQLAHTAVNGPFAGTLPGVNKSDVVRAGRIMGGDEEPDLPSAVPIETAHVGPLLPEVQLRNATGFVTVEARTHERVPISEPQMIAGQPILEPVLEPTEPLIESVPVAVPIGLPSESLPLVPSDGLSVPFGVNEGPESMSRRDEFGRPVGDPPLPGESNRSFETSDGRTIAPSDGLGVARVDGRGVDGRGVSLGANEGNFPLTREPGESNRFLGASDGLPSVASDGRGVAPLDGRPVVSTDGRGVPLGANKGLTPLTRISGESKQAFDARVRAANLSPKK